MPTSASDCVSGLGHDQCQRRQENRGAHPLRPRRGRLRLVKPEPAPYTWKESKPGEPRTFESKEPFAALIVEASRKANHATLEAFKNDVLKHPICMRQVIRSGYLLTYRGCGKDAKELYLNCARTNRRRSAAKP